METGTGKTYVYLRTIYELYQKYGFSKFIIVVPSVAIREGVKKSYEVTRDHFKTLYGNETVALSTYQGDRITDVKSFATNSNIEILLITLDAFNKASNKIYKATDKLPGELLPYQYIQRTRPIVILDEPQNMGTQKSKDAIRTFKPLCSVRYSATHKETPNLTYRLTPVEAFRRNLVKKIQVIGISDAETVGRALMSLREVKGSGGSARAVVTTNTQRGGVSKTEEVTLKTGNDLFAKTNNERHQGYTVVNIGSAKDNEFIEFANGITLTTRGGDGVSRPDIFHYQIRETIKQHIEMQKHLHAKGIKVLSLFFVDRVANFTGNENKAGVIQRIFDQEFLRLRNNYKGFEEMSPTKVRAAYFASYRQGKKQDKTVYLDGEATNKAAREAERKQYELIMRAKERMLSFDEPVAFIFAHSALREGWDNPNIFQICTLNQTVSITRKRQEIGRGLRLAVNQRGERVHDDQVNILTVIANESYEAFANALQQEYLDTDGEAPPKPKPKREAAIRQADKYSSEHFRLLWEKLIRRTSYRIEINNDLLLSQISDRLEKIQFPSPQVVITRGNFVLTDFTFYLQGFDKNRAVIDLIKEDSKGLRDPKKGLQISEGDDLAKSLKEPLLRGFVVNSIDPRRTNPDVIFKNGDRLTKFQPLRFTAERSTDQTSKNKAASLTSYPIFNVVDRLAEATSLTKQTCYQIFRSIDQDKKLKLKQNPDGFTNKLIEAVRAALADHIADNITFTVSSESFTRNVEELFPEKLSYVQTEIVDSRHHGLYDFTQSDSDIEKKFILYKLEKDDQVELFFKFPSKYRIPFPKIIGNYNPDWAVVRRVDDQLTVQLVRETKGTTDIEKLQFAHEIRKIKVAQRHFAALDIDYRVIKGNEETWYEKGVEHGYQTEMGNEER